MHDAMTAPKLPSLERALAEPERVADRLDAAATHIERHGWAQGFMRSVDGRVCAMGALNAVTRDGNVTYLVGATAYLAREIGTTDELADLGVVEWNDADGRTRSDVLDAMRRAAKRARMDADERDAATGLARATADA